MNMAKENGCAMFTAAAAHELFRSGISLFPDEDDLIAEIPVGEILDIDDEYRFVCHEDSLRTFECESRTVRDQVGRFARGVQFFFGQLSDRRAAISEIVPERVDIGRTRQMRGHPDDGNVPIVRPISLFRLAHVQRPSHLTFRCQSGPGIWRIYGKFSRLTRPSGCLVQQYVAN